MVLNLIMDCHNFSEFSLFQFVHTLFKASYIYSYVQFSGERNENQETKSKNAVATVWKRQLRI